MLLSEKEQEEIFKMTSTFKVPTDEFEQYIHTNCEDFYDEMDFKNSSEEEEYGFFFLILIFLQLPIFSF
jgi:hypothetical protein